MERQDGGQAEGVTGPIAQLIGAWADTIGASADSLFGQGITPVSQSLVKLT